MMYRARRRATSFEVFVQTKDGKRQASIVDITDKGARLRLDAGDLEKGAAVKVALRGKDHEALVVWTKEGEAGVAFERLLPLDVLSAVSRSMHRPTVKKT